MIKRPLIILTGPTAVGKTELSIALAKAVDGEIISADSMQVYKEMNIGTAKITPQEMIGVPHYLVDEIEPSEEFNVAKFQQLTIQYMEQIYAKNKVPILVGGTGFYIQSILYAVEFTKSPNDMTYRNTLEKLAEEKGLAYLYNMLKEVDPEATTTIHQNNVKRVIRALEYYQQTGEKISEHNKKQAKKESPYNFAYFVLNDTRENLYRRIDTRIDTMMESGLLKEVQMLKGKGYTKDMVSMQGLGYKEILAYLDGEITLEEAIYILKRDTRHFAKRQLTWFKRETDVIWIPKNEFQYENALILANMLDILNNKEII
jgi:tRNA dimethylallyltransferase